MSAPAVCMDAWMRVYVCVHICHLAPTRPHALIPINRNQPHRGALQHCGLRDTIGQLLGKAEPLRNARADDYSKGWKHANHLRGMAKALSEVGLGWDWGLV